MNRKRPRERALLTIDAAVNLGLGALLVVFPRPLVEYLGLPMPDTAFYPSILGAVLVGIGIALLVARHDGRTPSSGLGLVGAVTINLCGGVVLAVWLIAGHLELPIRGMVFLWLLVVLLVGLSSFELHAELRRSRTDRAV
jgi:hypothetical protein